MTGPRVGEFLVCLAIIGGVAVLLGLIAFVLWVLILRCAPDPEFNDWPEDDYPSPNYATPRSRRRTGEYP